MTNRQAILALVYTGACLVGLWVTWRGRGILMDAVRRP